MIELKLTAEVLDDQDFGSQIGTVSLNGTVVFTATSWAGGMTEQKVVDAFAARLANLFMLREAPTIDL